MVEPLNYATPPRPRKPLIPVRIKRYAALALATAALFVAVNLVPLVAFLLDLNSRNRFRPFGVRDMREMFARDVAEHRALACLIGAAECFTLVAFLGLLYLWQRRVEREQVGRLISPPGTPDFGELSRAGEG